MTLAINNHGNKGIVEKGFFSAQIDEICKDKLYLGNYEGAQNLNMLQNNKITGILVIGPELN